MIRKISSLKAPVRGGSCLSILRAGVLSAGLAMLGACSTIPVYPMTGAATDGSSLYGSYLAARHAGIQRDAASAAKFYSAALKHNPGDQAILERAFLLALNSGEVSEAVDLAKRIVKLRHTDRLARLVLAIDAMRGERFEDARNEIRKAGRGPLTDIINTLIVSWAYAGDGMTPVAISNLKELDRAGGLDLYKAYHSGLIYDLAGMANMAEANYDEAMRKSGAGSIRVVEAYGRFLERDGRHVQARAVYHEFAQNVGNHPLIAAASYRARKSQPLNVERLVKDPRAGAAEAIYALAGALARESQQRPDLPIVYLRLALYLYPDFDIAQSLLADLLEANNRLDASVKVYRGVRRSSPLWANARIRIAHVLNRMEQRDAAIKVLREVTEAAPDNLDVLTSIADLYHSNEEYETSAQYYGRAVAQVTDVKVQHWPLFYQYGIALERSKQWEKAEIYLKKALELQPDQPLVLNYLGYSWIDQGRHLKEAMEMIEKAVSLDPDNGYIVDSLGWGHYQLDQFEDAVVHLEKAVLLVPGDPIINDHLGDAYWQVGRKLEARFQWSHALDLDPDPEVKARAEAKLKKGLDVVLAEEQSSAKPATPANPVAISRAE